MSVAPSQPFLSTSRPVLPVIAATTALMATGCNRATNIVDPAWSHMTLLSLVALTAGAVVKSAERAAVNATWRPQRNEEPSRSLPPALTHSPEIRLEPMLGAYEEWSKQHEIKTSASKKATRVARWDRTTNALAMPIVASIAHLATSASPLECLMTGFIAGVVCAVPSSDAKKYDGIHHQLNRTFSAGMVPVGLMLLGVPASVALSLGGLLTGLLIATFPPRDPVSRPAREAKLYANALRHLESELGSFFLGSGEYKTFGRYEAPVFETGHKANAVQAYQKWRDAAERRESEQGRLQLLEQKFFEIEATLNANLRELK